MSDPLPDNPYKALGVAKDAQINDIKKAYRKLVLTCHPDKTGSLPEALKKEKDAQFHRVQEAHDLLTNPADRRRYDEKIQLEELRSEMRSELRKDPGRDIPPPLHKAATFSYKMPTRSAPPRSAASPIFNARGPPPIYETRSPKGVYDDDYIPSRYESARAPPPKKFEDRFGESSGSRRSSGRSGDDRRAERRDVVDEEDFYAKKSREKEVKAEQRASYTNSKKTRDKNRKQDIESKRYAQVESDSDTEPEIAQFMSPKRSPATAEPRRKVEEPLRKTRYVEKPRRAPSPDSESSDGGKLRQATAHINLTGTRLASDRDSRQDKRGAVKTRTARSPPPPPPMPPKIEPVKRSSGRRTNSRSTKDRKIPEIVEPSAELYEEPEYEKPRRPKPDPLQSQSSPKSAARSTFARTATAAAADDKQASLKRSQTVPHAVPPPSHPTGRSSRLKYSRTQKEEDSGYSSPGTPPDAAAQQRYTSTSYKYRVKTDTDSDAEAAKPRVVSVEPESISRREREKERDKDHSRDKLRREASPRTGPGIVEREPHRSSHRSELRSAPVRASTYEGTQQIRDRERDRDRDRRSHHHSSSTENGRLFGEIVPPANVKYSQKIDKGDIMYSHVPRSSTDPLAVPRERDRDRRTRDRSRSRGKDDDPFDKSARDPRPGSGQHGLGGRSHSHMQDIRA